MEDQKTTEIIEAAVRNALSRMEERDKQRERKKILYNTRLLMESYREMRRHVENAISEGEELEAEEFQFLKSEEAHLESARRSKLRTALMIANIDRAMSEIAEEMQEIGTSYKFDAFRMHYVEGVNYEDVADRLNCGKNTPSRWSKEILRKMSVKLFGIDGVEKW